MRACAVGLFVRVLLASAPAHAQAAPPEKHEDQAFDFMNVLSHYGVHDLEHEWWNAYGQATYISSWQLPFQAPYTNANGSVNSLLPVAERSYTSSVTLFLGVRLWRGARAYLVPEVISEVPLSQLRGLGSAIQNFELQKTGSTTPQLYRARTYLRQTFELGGTPVVEASNPMQLAAYWTSRRIVLTLGTFSILDVFDRNNVNWDPRQTFLNMAFMTNAAWDFAADARGYSFGGTAELIWDDWALRIGRMAPPAEPNVLPLDPRIDQHYSDSFEMEHDHSIAGRKGAVRLLAYRNEEITGRFSEAIATFEADPSKNAASCPTFNYGSGNFNAPSLCWVRRPNTKVGIGFNVEQYLVGSNLGVFARGMYSDGRTEVDAFDPADRSLSVGVVSKGGVWHRHFDVAGIGLAAAWISAEHAKYLAMGGVDGFVGDGRLNQAAESVVDVFYSFNLFKALWLSADYQHIWNPGFNADRGPVDILSGRVHAEF